jgi:hypothetical protein
VSPPTNQVWQRRSVFVDMPASRERTGARSSVARHFIAASCHHG